MLDPMGRCFWKGLAFPSPNIVETLERLCSLVASVAILREEEKGKTLSLVASFALPDEVRSLAPAEDFNGSSLNHPDGTTFLKGFILM